MKAITVQPPWSWAIIYAGKNPENRTKLWHHRGPLAIHSGKRWSERGTFHPEIVKASRKAGLGDWLAVDDQGEVSPASPVFLTGCVIGVVDLVDVHVAREGECCDSPWAEFEYPEHPTGKTRRDITHLVMENPRALPEPIPMPGKLDLWNLPEGMVL